MINVIMDFWLKEKGRLAYEEKEESRQWKLHLCVCELEN